MKQVLRIFSVFASILICNSALAQETLYYRVAEAEIPSYKAKIELASASLTSLQCSFIQKKNISVLSESVTSKGKLLYKNGNKLCWEYTSPYYYLFALNGDKVYIKNGNTTSQFDTKSNALFKEISLLLLNSISGSGLIDTKKFDVVFFESATTLKTQLIPRNKTLKSLLSTITLYFEKATYLVHSIEMTEPSGDSTVIVFNEVVQNQPISDESFVVR